MPETYQQLHEEMKEKREALAMIAAALQADGVPLREIGRRLGMSHELARKLIKSVQRGTE